MCISGTTFYEVIKMLGLFGLNQENSLYAESALLPQRVCDAERMETAKRVLEENGGRWDGRIIAVGPAGWSAPVSDSLMIPVATLKTSYKEYLRTRSEILFAHVVLRNRAAEILKETVLKYPEWVPFLHESLVSGCGFPDECRVEFAKNVSLPRFDMKKVVFGTEKKLVSLSKRKNLFETVHEDRVRFIVVGRMFGSFVKNCGDAVSSRWFGSEERIVIPATAACVFDGTSVSKLCPSV